MQNSETGNRSEVRSPKSEFEHSALEPRTGLCGPVLICFVFLGDSSGSGRTSARQAMDSWQFTFQRFFRGGQVVALLQVHPKVG